MLLVHWLSRAWLLCWKSWPINLYTICVFKLGPWCISAYTVVFLYSMLYPGTVLLEQQRRVLGLWQLDRPPKYFSPSSLHFSDGVNCVCLPGKDTWKRSSIDCFTILTYEIGYEIGETVISFFSWQSLNKSALLIVRTSIWDKYSFYVSWRKSCRFLGKEIPPLFKG